MQTISGLDDDALHAGYWAFRHDYDRGSLTGHAYWQAVAGHAGTAFNDDQIQALIDADADLWTQLNLPMVDWAARLQAAGIRTGILSNIGDSIAESIRARLPWLTRFDHCTWSHELRMAKPEAAIYIATAKSLETAPANILFIDDREDNIAAARAAGFQAIHYVFNDHPAFEREMRNRGLSALLDVTPVLS
jgi:putative hydrolase of the HAD superfamily